MTNVVIQLIKAYQIINRATFPPTCRFYPSCSCYALDAIQKYGIIKGTLKALVRIVRCSPLSRGGYDPVK